MTKFFALFLLFTFVVQISAQSSEIRFPVKRTETPETWRRDGLAAIARSKNLDFKKRKAKNVILFVGDGMGITTLAAARIMEGQMRGESGEENLLSFEQFPFSALSKTYSVNQQTSDSAPTMSAIITGLKTDDGIISVNQNVVYNDYKTVKGNEAISLLTLAEQAGKATGIVTTARLTHATPAACYAHSPNRDWESDTNILAKSKEAYDFGFADIARQLIEYPYGDGLEVALGGGRQMFLPKENADPEYDDKTGVRSDKKNLPEEWKTKFKGEYVWNKQQFDAIDAKKTKHLLGLFEPDHMQYEHDRLKKDKAGEPSLSEMTSKAIDILKNNKNGFFLMVEAGRIDHAHHDGNAFRALRDTIELSNAVRTAQNKIDLKDTLIIVTADHSHTLSFSGYPGRGNNILGLVREIKRNGEFDENSALDLEKKPYTTLNYANGTGYKKDRPNLTQEQVTNPDYKQEAIFPKTAETHGGEDVGIFAIGANAWTIHGVMEQNWIFYAMQEALQLKKK